MIDLSEIYGRSLREMAAASISPQTQAFIEPAIVRLINAIELACPVAMGAAQVGAFRVAYGPLDVPKGTKFLFFAATPQTAIGGPCPNWPSPADIPEDLVHSPGMWDAMVRLIDEGDFAIIPSFIIARMGAAKVAEAKRLFRAIRRQGNTPTLIAAMASARGPTQETIRATGMMSVITLPPSIKTQFAE